MFNFMPIVLFAQSAVVNSTSERDRTDIKDLDPDWNNHTKTKNVTTLKTDAETDLLANLWNFNIVILVTIGVIFVVILAVVGCHWKKICS